MCVCVVYYRIHSRTIHLLPRVPIAAAIDALRHTSGAPRCAWAVVRARLESARPRSDLAELVLILHLANEKAKSETQRDSGGVRAERAREKREGGEDGGRGRRERERERENETESGKSMVLTLPSFNPAQAFAQWYASFWSDTAPPYFVTQRAIHASTSHPAGEGDGGVGVGGVGVGGVGDGGVGAGAGPGASRQLGGTTVPCASPNAYSHVSFEVFPVRSTFVRVISVHGDCLGQVNSAGALLIVDSFMIEAEKIDDEPQFVPLILAKVRPLTETNVVEWEGGGL